MNRIVGMDKMLEIQEAEKIKGRGIEVAQKQRAEEIKNIEKNAFVKPKKKKPRGTALWDEKRKKEHMDKMRKKAIEAKRKRADERKKQKKELEKMKLCQKLGISMETLLEYEEKRQKFKKEEKPKVENVVEEKPKVKAIIEEKPKPIKQEPKPIQQAPRQIQQAPKPIQYQPTPIDYDKLSNMIYGRIRQEENEKIIKRQDERIAKQNALYFKGLGRANMNKNTQDDAWLQMFRRK